MNTAQPRIRAMKARRKSTCRCGRLIQVGNRIIRVDSTWICVDCAIAIATAKQAAAQTRTAP